MTDVMERLRAANPIAGCPPTSIQDVWRRVEDNGQAADVEWPAASPPSRRLSPRLRGLLMIAASTAVAFAVVAVVLLAHHPTSTGNSSATGPATPARPRSEPTDPRLATMFSVLGRKRSKTDRLPAAYREELARVARGLGLDPDRARKLHASNGQPAYLVPARVGACIISAIGPVCARTTRLPGAFALDLCSPDLPQGRVELQWVLPDDARDISVRLNRDTPVVFPAGYNVYITALPTAGSVPRFIQWEQGGRRRSAGVLPTGGDRSLRCEHSR
jgi:hypothetical protein